MIIQKFNYQKLSRKNIDGKRHYITPDGTAVGSVTSILDQTKPSEAKEALNNWRKRVGTQQAAEITLSASSRGTRMHKFLENYINNGDLGKPGTNPFSIESHKMAAHVYDQSLKYVTEFYGSEVSLYYPSLYAGTTDVVAMYKDNLTIIDFKQSNKPKKSEWVDDYRMQLCAYLTAHNEVYGTDIKHGIIMMCTPELQYQQFEITPENVNEWTDKWFGRVGEYYGV